MNFTDWNGQPWTKVAVMEFLKPGVKWGLFHTVRYGDKSDYYHGLVGKTIPIEHNSKAIGYGVVKNVEGMHIDDLELDFVRDDTFSHFKMKDFLDVMRRFYGKKPDWKEEKTWIIIVWFNFTRT